MTNRVLFIDDDPYALAGYARIARRGFEVETATGGEDGLEVLGARGPFAVVISDMRMPGINGAETLHRASQVAPDTTRVLLTGHADLDSAIDAVNRGNVFRFLTKPCPPDALLGALKAAAAQHRLVLSERELREKTLQGSLKVLTDVMAMVHPTAFGRVGRVRELVCELGRRLDVENQWELPIVAGLCLLGTVALPDGVMAKVMAGHKVCDRDANLLQTHPRVAYEMLVGIPQLGGVAEAILYQAQRYNGTGGYTIPRRGAEIPMASRLLKVAMDFEALVGLGYSREQAVREMNKRDGWYDPEVLEVLAEISTAAPPKSSVAVSLSDLRPGMVLAAPLLYSDGGPLFKMGQPLTDALIQRVWAVADSVGLQEPVEVYLPTEAAPVVTVESESRLTTQADDLHGRPTEHSEARPTHDTDPALRSAFPELFQT
jgi:response regulator RpfG family c-di-GMP phosphodiesterase